VCFAVAREFWVDLGDRVYELRAPTSVEAQVWVQYFSAYAGCLKKDGKSLNKVPIPAPLFKGMMACLGYLIQHGTHMNRLWFMMALLFCKYRKSAHLELATCTKPVICV